MYQYRIYLTVAAAVIGMGAVYPFVFGRSSVVPAAKTIYVDRKSGEAFLLLAKSSPANHPRTGDPTLFPGMYCEKCHAWKMVGPMNRPQGRRTVVKCPIHKTPLLRDGPLPDEA